MRLKERSYRNELLDEEFIPFADIRQNMNELNFINTWLGGHRITVEGFRQLAGEKKEISICEIGCGGGDNLVAINKWCIKKGIGLTAIGIDIKEACIDVAKSRSHDFSAATWLASDYRDARLETKPDIIFSSLFCHHFTEQQLVYQLQWMKENSKLGFFINDLQRHFIAYYAIKLLTKAFSKSYLVKNDAPLSVARGFTRNEWMNICRQANVTGVNIHWKWAFRYLLVFAHD
ncbi:MAG: methyltransferase domain-containing protein [Bacteroidota bacterium]|nr:methyltransferase domain-containing protein [Bacteroidota bacterium]